MLDKSPIREATNGRRGPIRQHGGNGPINHLSHARVQNLWASYESTPKEPEMSGRCSDAGRTRQHDGKQPPLTRRSSRGIETLAERLGGWVSREDLTSIMKELTKIWLKQERQLEPPMLDVIIMNGLEEEMRSGVPVDEHICGTLIMIGVNWSYRVLER